MSRQDLATSRPTVVVIGRPNVGKSTLVNRFLGRREAIVEEEPGVTRDRKVTEIEWAGRYFTLIDTGGWLATGESLAAKVSKQAERAVDEADLVLFVVDAETGITDEDEKVAAWLRRAQSQVLLVANKVDNERREIDMWELSRLGYGDPFGLSALHGRNSGDLLDAIVAQLPPPGSDETIASEDASEPRIAICGRPNVGKSTLFNRMVGDERTVVHDLPGTTRDTIDTVIETDDGPLRFVDTAGMRRTSRIDEGIEYYSLVRALQAIDTADVVVLVIDATQGVAHQDQRLAERIEVAGKPVVIALNKWEQLDAERRAALTAGVESDLGFIGYAPVLKISALSGKGVHKILPALRESIAAYTRRLPTAEVTKVIMAAQEAHSSPGARIFYATQGATEPPTFTLFANRRLEPQYLRYLERKLREHFDLGPSPIKLRVRRKGG